MRRKKSFLITIIPTEEPQKAFCGQVKSVSTGRAFTFSDKDEFQRLLMDELAANNHEGTQVDLTSSVKVPAAIKP